MMNVGILAKECPYFYIRAFLKGGTHKTVLEMFSGNGVACGLRRFSVM